MPLSGSALAQRLSKTGGTPYRCVEVRTHVDPGLTISAAAINAMRREVLNQLTALRARREDHPLRRSAPIAHYPGPKGIPGLTIQVTSRDQLTPKLINTEATLLYVPVHILLEDMQLLEKLLRRGLNIFNSASMNVLRDLELSSATASFEMTLPQIRDLSKGVNTEIIAYGRLPLMLTEHCLMKNRTGECSCQNASSKLTDKTGAEFPIIKDGNNCRSVLLNGKKLSWLDRQSDLARLGLWCIRLYFTTENPREVDRVLADYMEPTPFDPGACTRGLYLRGVE